MQANYRPITYQIMIRDLTDKTNRVVASSWLDTLMKLLYVSTNQRLACSPSALIHLAPEFTKFQVFNSTLFYFGS